MCMTLHTLQTIHRDTKSNWPQDNSAIFIPLSTLIAPKILCKSTTGIYQQIKKKLSTNWNRDMIERLHKLQQRNATKIYLIVLTIQASTRCSTDIGISFCISEIWKVSHHCNLSWLMIRQHSATASELLLLLTKYQTVFSSFCF